MIILLLNLDSSLLLCSFCSAIKYSSSSNVFKRHLKLSEDCTALSCWCTRRKTIFPFSKCFKKMVSQKKMYWNMTFLALSGKMIFIFPENIILYYILFFRPKRKNDIREKNIRKYDVLFKCSEKMVFLNIRTGIWYYL